MGILISFPEFPSERKALFAHFSWEILLFNRVAFPLHCVWACLAGNRVPSHPLPNQLLALWRPPAKFDSCLLPQRPCLPPGAIPNPKAFSRHKSRCLPDVAAVNDFYIFLPTMRIFYTESSFATLTCLKCFGTFLPTRRKFFTYSQENIAKRCCISKNTTYTENLLHSGFF
jgi:hypothetical protein